MLASRPCFLITFISSDLPFRLNLFDTRYGKSIITHTSTLQQKMPNLQQTTFFFYFFFFSEIISLQISCESSAWQTIYMKIQDLFFFWEMKQKSKLSSAAFNKIMKGSPVSVSLGLTFKCDPSVVQIILWGILLFPRPLQSAQHVSNMFSYQSVNGAKIVSQEDSEKNVNFKKIDFFTPKRMGECFFFFCFCCCFCLFFGLFVFFFWFFCCCCCFLFFFFQNVWNLFLFVVKPMIYPKLSLANSTFLGVKDTQIGPEKEVNPLKSSVIPHKPWMIYRGYL